MWFHSHLIFSNVSLDCTHKYEEDYKSAAVVAEMSDTICKEHGLSVIEHPQGKSLSYDKWQGENVKPRARDGLRAAIDEALRKNPEGFDALMQLMEEAGWKIKRGKQISFKAPDGKRFMRMDTLGPEYSEASLRATLAGKHVHVPKKQRGDPKRKRIGRLIDIEAKRQEGKGGGYIYTSKRINTKTAGATMSYLKIHGLRTDRQIMDYITGLTAEQEIISSRIAAADVRLNEITETRNIITSYRRTIDVYIQYRESGWSPKFLEAHRQEIATHMEAKKAYDAVHGKMPLLKDLNAEFRQLVDQKKLDRQALTEKRREVHEALNVKANYEILRGDKSPKLRSVYEEDKQ